MVRKFFPLDKNYLLEEAQLALQEDLLTALVKQVQVAFSLRHNPLGLIDSYSGRILSYRPKNLKALHPFYQNLAAVYRYKHGDNQLEFVWDGREHLEKYRAEWTASFEKWVISFCRKELFIKAVLDLTVFLPDNKQVQMVENRMNHFILEHFEVKIHKKKGIVTTKVA